MAAIPAVRRGRGAPGEAGATAALGQRAAAAERVGLIEEDDHAAVPECQPAQLAEE